MSDTLHNDQHLISEAPLVEGNHTFSSITDTISSIVEKKPPNGWLIAFLFAFSGFLILNGSILYLIWEGTGIWGLNNPVGWGFAIVNFVFWVGIGHAGTLISAVLFLFCPKIDVNKDCAAFNISGVVCAASDATPCLILISILLLRDYYWHISQYLLGITYR